MQPRSRKRVSSDGSRIYLILAVSMMVLIAGGLRLKNGEHEQVPTRSSSSPRQIQCFVGVQTGFPKPHAIQKYDYVSRRRVLRETWFPDRERRRFLEEEGIVVRFVVGHSEDPEQERLMNEEEKAYDDLLRLDLIEHYLGLPQKTITFFKTVMALYNPEFIFKVDDDVYLRLPALAFAIPQWREMGSGYIGCMKNGKVFKTSNLRWYEPQHALMGSSDKYFTHAWGPCYVISRKAAAIISSLEDGSLRFFNNEDVSVGSWMLALNVLHEDDRRLCDVECKETTIAVYDLPKCSGLCNVTESLPRLHNNPTCRQPIDATTFHRTKPYFTFKEV